MKNKKNFVRAISMSLQNVKFVLIFLYIDAHCPEYFSLVFNTIGTSLSYVVCIQLKFKHSRKEIQDTSGSRAGV